jgi:hypothetical protein
MHKNLKWLPHIEGAFLKFINRNGSYSGLGASILANKYQVTVPLNSLKKHSNRQKHVPSKRQKIGPEY